MRDSPSSLVFALDLIRDPHGTLRFSKNQNRPLALAAIDSLGDRPDDQEPVRSEPENGCEERKRCDKPALERNRHLEPEREQLNEHPRRRPRAHDAKRLVDPRDGNVRPIGAASAQQCDPDYRSDGEKGSAFDRAWNGEELFRGESEKSGERRTEENHSQVTEKGE